MATKKSLIDETKKSLIDELAEVPAELSASDVRGYMEQAWNTLTELSQNKDVEAACRLKALDLIDTYYSRITVKGIVDEHMQEIHRNGRQLTDEVKRLRPKRDYEKDES